MNIRGLLTLSFVPGVGNQRLRSLLEYFSDPADAFNASVEELKSIPSIDVRTARAISQFDQNVDEVDRILRKVERMGAKILAITEPGYPLMLKKIYDPPAFLYVLGEMKDQDHDAIAIVGTRTPSEYGKSVTERLSADLVRAGFTIVSGLARGIDTIAHRVAVRTGGRTIAVIGCGIDIVYPQDNVRISQQIQKNGAIVSEYHTGTKPDAVNFPRRNRIISGMSLGTVIIESSETGGAMITASYALDQNREIFAIPGPITDKRSSGTNRLIQQGRAKLVQRYEDILEEVVTKLRFITPEGESVRTTPPPNLNIFEQKIFEILSHTPMHIDTIAESSGISTSDALVHLLSLEFKGAVKQLAGKMFCRA